MSIFLKLLSFGLLMFLGLSFAGHGLRGTPFTPAHTTFFTTALAEDEEDEGDERDEDDEDRPSTSSSSSSSQKTEYKTVKVIQEVIEYHPVTETVMVTKEDYARDTDQDGLVDAIDPDPLVPQSEYYSDIDGDGVPNALDQHHDEDDFAYFDFETDDNNNGIIDSYEQP